MIFLRRSLALLSISLFAACGDDPPPNLPGDSGVFADAADTGTSTAGDSGVGPDGMVITPDSGPIIDECNPLTQTGCNDPVESKCIVEGREPRGGTQCVEPNNVEKMLGEQCIGGECGPSLVCVRTASVSRCHQICDQTGMGCEALGAAFACEVGLRDTNWRACVELPPACDLVTQDPCPQDQACQFYLRYNMMLEARCRPAGTGVDGDNCGGMNPGCARGFICVSELGVSRCRKTCTDNAHCTAPKTCRSTAGPARYCS